MNQYQDLLFQLTVFKVISVAKTGFSHNINHICKWTPSVNSLSWHPRYFFISNPFCQNLLSFFKNLIWPCCLSDTSFCCLILFSMVSCELGFNISSFVLGFQLKNTSSGVMPVKEVGVFLYAKRKLSSLCSNVIFVRLDVL